MPKDTRWKCPRSWTREHKKPPVLPVNELDERVAFSPKNGTALFDCGHRGRRRWDRIKAGAVPGG